MQILPRVVVSEFNVCKALRCAYCPNTGVLLVIHFITFEFELREQSMAQHTLCH